MLHKYDHSKKVRTIAWRRFQEDNKVKHRLINDSRYNWSVDDGGIDYGRSTWVNSLGAWQARKAKTSYSYKRSRYDYYKEYRRSKYRRHTKRLLWEEGIIERIGHR